MWAYNGVLYHVLGLVACVALIYFSLGDVEFHFKDKKASFVGRNGTRFYVEGRVFYVNGWNSYWLMDQAVEEATRPRVGAIFGAGAKMGLSVCRTWAFNDGYYNALQVSPGHFDENVFKVYFCVLRK